MHSKKIKKNIQSSTMQILLAMALGLIVGIIFNHFKLESHPTWRKIFVDGIFEIGGRAFLASLRVLVVPIVFVSLVCGTASLDDVQKLGRVGIRVFLYYLFSTALAISIAVLSAVLIRPGDGLNLSQNLASGYEIKEKLSLVQMLIGLFPTNPVRAMGEENMLQLIFLALFFGATLTITGKSGNRISEFFKDLNEVLLKMVTIVMHFAPLGVFCLLAKVFSLQGFSVITPLAKYFSLVAFILMVHLFGSYSMMLKFFSGLSPKVFFRKIKDTLIFAFSTSSSNATLPVTLEAVEHRLGVPNSIASFAIPLGATVNMDGTAIMQGIAAVFISQVYGIDIGLNGYITVIFTATLASIGSGGIPGSGLITLAMVLRQVNLPVEGIALILGVDRFLDMLRTVVNVAGDAVVSCIVARNEKQLDEKVFHS